MTFKHIKNVYQIFDEELDKNTIHILIEFNNMDLSDCFQNGNSIKFVLYKKEIALLKTELTKRYGDTFQLYGTRELLDFVISDILKSKNLLTV